MSWFTVEKSSTHVVCPRCKKPGSTMVKDGPLHRIYNCAACGPIPPKVVKP